MAWRAVTENDIKTRLSGAELSGYRSAALAAGQSDPVQPTIDLVTELVRGYVGACGKNTLGAVGTLPEKLIGVALDLIVVEIPKRCAGQLLDPKGLRKEAADRAYTVLRDVAGCRFQIDAPVIQTTEKLSLVTPQYCARSKIFTRELSEGL
jgi:hypothetical protein